MLRWLIGLTLLLTACGSAAAPPPTLTAPSTAAPTALPATAPPTSAPAAPAATPTHRTPPREPVITDGPTAVPPVAPPAATATTTRRIPPREPVITAAPTLQTYTAPDGSWQISYPDDLLHVERLGALVLFISADRGTVAAVDTLLGDGATYGNTGEGLRNRARLSLEQIYGAPVSEALDAPAPPAPWATGVGFTTAKGSTGAALYMQPASERGDFRVFGFLMGYKAQNAAVAPRLLAMRELVHAARRPAGRAEG